MIETRAQRKRSTLLHRRKVGIIAFALVFVILGTSCILLFNYVNNVIPFTDVDGTEYYIKKVSGVFAMYDKEGNLLPMEDALDSSERYYVTLVGTTIKLDSATGEYIIRSIPALYYEADGEFVDHEVLTVFKGVSGTDIRKIEIKNQEDAYTLFRYDLKTLQENDDADFVLKESPISTLDKSKMSYLTYIVGHPLVKSRVEDPIVDANGQFSEYGLVSETRTDSEGKEYSYEPTTFTITTKSGVKHTIILGDKLVSGEGYYLQYQNNEGEKRPAVYVFNPSDMTDLQGSNIYDTILAPAKSLVTPFLIYPTSTEDYYDVQNFSIKKKSDGALKETVSFSYIDLEDRTGTVEGTHPYKFNKTSYASYRPNYDNIDIALNMLRDPTINQIAVLAPTKEDKVAYGLMKKEVDGDKVTYTYDSEYTISFDRVIYLDEEQTQKVNVQQIIYISKPNESGSYYTFTEMHYPDSTPDSLFSGVSFDTICEVSPASMEFVDWEVDDWVYPAFMHIGILYTKKIEFISAGYNASFVIKNTKVANLNILQVDTVNNKGESYSTFGSLQFKDMQGNAWTVSDEDIYILSADGQTEMKPATRAFEYNSIDRQVEVSKDPVRDIDGNIIYIEKDYVRVHYVDGTVKEYLRYHNTIFRKLFLTVTGTNIVDSYSLTPEEETALLSDASKHQITIKITDENDKVTVSSFYRLTDRKSYVTVDIEGDDVDAIGGFYVQAGRVEKFISDAEKFFAGQDIDQKAHK